MKKLLTLLLCASFTHAQDLAISQLTEKTNAVNATNITVWVDQAMTPRTRRITATNLANYFRAGLVPTLNGSATNLTLITPHDTEFTNLWVGALDVDIATFGNSIIDAGTPFKRRGIVLPNNGAPDENAVWEPVVLPDEPNPVILTSESTVWKMWHTVGWGSGGIEIGYAESTNGLNWTRLGHNVLTNYMRSTIHKEGSTYIMYATGAAETNVWRFESTSGTNWTLNPSTNVLTLGAPGSWDDGYIGNTFVWRQDPNLYHMFYDSRRTNTAWGDGYATSTNGITWNKYTNGSVIQDGMGGPWVTNTVINGSPTWIAFVQGPPVDGALIPTDIYIYSTTATVPTNFTRAGMFPVLARGTLAEGAFDTFGQVADTWIVENGGNIYLYYEAGRDGVTVGSEFNIYRAYTTSNWTQIMDLAGSPDRIKAQGDANFTQLNLIGIYPLITKPSDYGTNGIILQGGLQNNPAGLFRIGYNTPGAVQDNDTTYSGAFISFDVRTNFNPMQGFVRAAGNTAESSPVWQVNTNGWFIANSFYTSNWFGVREITNLPPAQTDVGLFTVWTNNVPYYIGEATTNRIVTTTETPIVGRFLKWDGLTYVHELAAGGSNGSTVYFNATNITAPNFTNTTKFFWNVTLATNVAGVYTNIENADISASAAIAKSKISTSGTWADADLPSTFTRDVEWDSVPEIEAAVGGVNILLATELSSLAQLDGLIGIAGTPSASTFWRGDNSWAPLSLNAPWNLVGTNIDRAVGPRHLKVLTNDIQFGFTNMGNGDRIELWVINGVGGEVVTFETNTWFFSRTNSLLVPTTNMVSWTTNIGAHHRFVVDNLNGTNIVSGPLDTTDNINLTDLAALSYQAGTVPGWATNSSGVAFLTNVVAGSSVYANGSSASNPNFNDSTPAAPTDATNVKFQLSGTNISAYIGPSVTLSNVTASGTFSADAFTTPTMVVSNWMEFPSDTNQFAQMTNNGRAGIDLNGDNSVYTNALWLFYDSAAVKTQQVISVPWGVAPTNGQVVGYDATGKTNKWITPAGSAADDTAFASSWNGVTTVSPSKNVVYDWGHIFDADDDGKVDVLDLAAAGFPAINSSGALVASRTIAEGAAIDVTNGDGASGNPTIAVDFTEADNVTWSAGGSTALTHTFNVSTGVDIATIATNDFLILQGGLDMQRAIQISGDIAAAEITADQNNWNPTGFTNASVVYMTASASWNITGLQVAAGWDGMLKTLYNGEPIGSSTNITLVSASTSSATTNRFSFAQDIILGPGDAVTVRYYATDSRWHMHSRGPISIMNFANMYTGSIVNSNTITSADISNSNNLASYNGAFTNALTLNGAGVKTNRVGVVRSVDIPLNTFYTNGVATSVAASAIWTNAAGVSWTFADGATNTTRFNLAMPVEWGAGTVRMRFEMGSSLTNNTSNTNVVFGLKAGSVGNGETWTNITFGTQITFTNHIHKSPYRTVTCVTPDLTIGNTPAVNKPIVWELTRLNSDGADVNTNTIAIVNAQLFYTETQTEPSMPAVTN